MDSRPSIPAAPGDKCVSRNTPLGMMCGKKVRAKKTGAGETLLCPKCGTSYGTYIEA